MRSLPNTMPSVQPPIGDVKAMAAICSAFFALDFRGERTSLYNIARQAKAILSTDGCRQNTSLSDRIKAALADMMRNGSFVSHPTNPLGDCNLDGKHFSSNLRRELGLDPQSIVDISVKTPASIPAPDSPWARALLEQKRRNWQLGSSLDRRGP